MSWLREQLAATRRTLRSTEPQAPKALPFAKYEQDPIGFFRDVLDMAPWEAPDGQDSQASIIRAALLPSVAVRSGHKIGKSSAAAGIAWWWFETRPAARVIMLAPTGHQVKNILWRELRRLKRAAGSRLPYEVPVLPSTGVHADDGREIIGLTADDTESFSGISGPSVLYLADEASGIDEDIFEAIEGNRAGGAHRILFSNPTRPSGTFREAFHGAREFYTRLHISSEVASRHGASIPGIATAEWVAEMLRKYGADSPIFQVRVEGNFAAEAENAIIGLGLVEDATARWNDTPYEGELVIGVDVAREGDDETAIAPRRGRRIYPLEVMHSQDGVQVAAKVAEVAVRLRQVGERPLVNVDVIGVGASVVDALTYNHRDTVRCVGVNTSESADEDERFHNLRAQLHFGARDWLKDGGAIPDDAELQAELIAPTFKFDARGRYQAEGKKDIKKRLRRSPDRGDAVMLSTYSGSEIRWSATREPAPVSRWSGMGGRGFG